MLVRKATVQKFKRVLTAAKAGDPAARSSLRKDPEMRRLFALWKAKVADRKEPWMGVLNRLMVQGGKRWASWLSGATGMPWVYKKGRTLIVGFGFDFESPDQDVYAQLKVSIEDSGGALKYYAKMEFEKNRRILTQSPTMVTFTDPKDLVSDSVKAQLVPLSVLKTLSEGLSGSFNQEKQHLIDTINDDSLAKVEQALSILRDLKTRLKSAGSTPAQILSAFEGIPFHLIGGAGSRLDGISRSLMEGVRDLQKYRE